MTKNTDFFAWDLIHELSLEEAALLLIGVDPARTDIEERGRAQGRIYERAAREAIARADYLAWKYFDDQFVEDMPVSSDIWELEQDFEKFLPTFEMRNSVEHVINDPENAAILTPDDPWYSATVCGGDFNAWLTRNGVRSAYEFKNSQSLVVAKLDHMAVIDARRAENGFPPFDEEFKFSSAEKEVSKLLTPERPLGNRERNTLLCMIGILCKEAGLDLTKTAKTAGLILSTADKMGVKLGETTIEGHLKKIPDALGTRMK